MTTKADKHRKHYKTKPLNHNQYHENLRSPIASHNQNRPEMTTKADKAPETRQNQAIKP